MSPLIHLANLLYVISYVLRDILWLRIVAVVASILSLVTLALTPNPLPESIAWTLLFFLINVVRIKLLILERRPVQLSRDEQRLHELAFPALPPREMLKLLAIGKWQDERTGAILVKAGKELDSIMLILDGKAAVKKDGDMLVELGQGRFVGEMCFLTGQPPAADVETLAPTRFVR